MEKQKICIVGGGLTGLITAITLSKLNLQIDLITDENYNKKRLLFRIWLAPPYSMKLPNSWQDFWRSIEPGTVRGGIHGHKYNNICKLFENNQAKQFNMPIPNKLQ